MEKKPKLILIFLLGLLGLLAGWLIWLTSLHRLTLKGFKTELAVSWQELETARKISLMPLEEKVGLVFMVGFDGPVLTESHQQFFGVHHFQNFLLLGRNIQTEDQLTALTASLGDGLIAVDQEGGQVARISFGGIDNTSQAEINSREQAYQAALNRAEVLREAGINMVLAPVVELNQAPDSYLAQLGRAFPGGAGQVCQLSQSMLKAYNQQGIVAVVKHYPGGLGRISPDPHQTLPTVAIDQAGLNQDLEPFKQLIAGSQVQALMTTHLLYPRIDSQQPVTTSEKFIKAILRERLGYQGLIVSDDLRMGAISGYQPVDQVGVAAFSAGHDLMILSGPAAAQASTYQALLRAVEAGEISEARLNQSVKRILLLQANLN